MILYLSDSMYQSDQFTYNAYILAIEWMKSLTNNIITCGHNGKVFDGVNFINALFLLNYISRSFIKLFLQIPCLSMDFLQTDYAGKKTN